MTLLLAGDMPSPEVPDAAEPASVEHTIDDLARVSEVPSRTIRFYQSKGLLPRPMIRGRVAYYGAPHLERLKLIASLQDRGLRIEAIRELVLRIDKGELDLGEWLGLEAQLGQPWGEDRPCTATEEEIYELSGRRRAGLLKDLLRADLVKRQGNVFLVPSPALLRIAARLEAAGLDLATVTRGGEILRKHLGRSAKELTELFVKHASDVSEADYARVLAELRPLVIESVNVVFGQEMERRLRELVETGRTTRVARRRQR